MNLIKVVGFDPALSNFGIAHADFNLDDRRLVVTKLTLVQTEKGTIKTVRKSSDDMDRARLLHNGMIEVCGDASIAFAEIPTGTQDARGSFSNGICCGVLAGCPLPLIQVSPTEVKMAAIGHKYATKQEMIQWAMNKHPEAKWLMRKSKGAMVPLNDNEHLADALAAIYAGIKTDQFKQATAMFGVMRGTATV